MKFDDYIGIPFVDNGNTRKGCDCWRLVVMVYQDHLNIDLPDFDGLCIDRTGATALLSSLRRIRAKICEYKEKWKRVENPQPYDVIILRNSDDLYHCGIAINRREMLHTMEGIDSAIEDFTGLYWKDRIEGISRYTG